MVGVLIALVCVSVCIDAMSMFCPTLFLCGWMIMFYIGNVRRAAGRPGLYGVVCLSVCSLCRHCHPAQRKHAICQNLAHIKLVVISKVLFTLSTLCTKIKGRIF